MGYVIANVVAWYVLALVAMIAAQTLVALGARMLGDRVACVRLGNGPLVRMWTSGRFAVSLHVVPIFGFSMIVTSRERGQRARLVAAQAMSAAVLVFAYALVRQQLGPDAWRTLPSDLASRFALDLVLAIAILQAFVFTLTFCFIKWTPEQLAAQRRLATLFEVSALLQRDRCDDAIALAECALAKSPDEPNLLLHLATALTMKSDPSAFDLVERLALRDDIPPHIAGYVDNLRAWGCVERGTDDLRGEADRASARALEQLPTTPEVIGTRGHVLAWLGRSAEAEVLLRRAYATTRQRSTRALDAAGLAMLCMAHDRIDEATLWLDRARAEGYAHPLVSRAIAAVEPLARP